MKVFSWSLTTVSPFVKLNVPFNNLSCYTGVFHLLHHLFHLFSSSVGLDNIDFLDTNMVTPNLSAVVGYGLVGLQPYQNLS